MDDGQYANKDVFIVMDVMGPDTHNPKLRGVWPSGYKGASMSAAAYAST